MTITLRCSIRGPAVGCRAVQTFPIQLVATLPSPFLEFVTRANTGEGEKKIAAHTFSLDDNMFNFVSSPLFQRRKVISIFPLVAFSDPQTYLSSVSRLPSRILYQQQRFRSKYFIIFSHFFHFSSCSLSPLCTLYCILLIS